MCCAHFVHLWGLLTPHFGGLCIQHRRQRPDEMLRRHDEKQRLALERKEALEAQRQEKLRGAEQLRQDKLRQLRERRENFQCHMDQRLQRAQELRQAQLLDKRLKAQKEHSKVNGVKQEIAFMELLNAETKTNELQHRLESAEARRMQSLEATARSSEKAAREEAARLRRLQLKGEKLQRLEERKVRIGHGAMGADTELEGRREGLGGEGEEGRAGDEEGREDGEARDSEDGEVDACKDINERHGRRDAAHEGGGIEERKTNGHAPLSRTLSREEAARARRREIEEERLKRIQEKEDKDRERQEERQRLMVNERMVTLASKEARLRSQAEQLSRLTAEMQADADQQREALEARLQAVIVRRKRYMQQVIHKAQAASELRRSVEERGSRDGDGGDEDRVPREGEQDKRGRGGRKDWEEEAARDLLPWPRKAMRKRMRKFRQRLLSVRSGWNEAVDGEGDCEREGGGLGLKGVSAGGGGRGSRVSRLLSDLVKSAPRKEDLDEKWPSEKGRGDGGDGSRGADGGRGAHRDVSGMDGTLRELLSLLTSSPQDRACGVASASERSGGGRGRDGRDGREGREGRDAGGIEAIEELDKVTMLVMVRKSGAMAALARLLATACDSTPLEAALRVLECACQLETNRLYLIATGRLLGIVNLAETHIHVPAWRSYHGGQPEQQLNTALAESCVRVLGLCLSEAPRTAGQLEARDYLVGYLVNTNLLSRVERLIIWGTQALSAGSVAEKKDGRGGEEDMDSHTHSRGQGLLRIEQKLLGYSVSLLQAITAGDTLGKRVRGGVADEGVLVNLIASLQACGLGGVVPLLSSLFLDSRMSCMLRWRAADDGADEYAGAEDGESWDGWGSVSKWGAQCSLAALKVLTNVALIDLRLLQQILGSVTVQAEFSHIALQVFVISFCLTCDSTLALCGPD